MAFMVMKHVGFSFNNLFTEAMAVHPKGAAIMSPGGLVKDPISALSGSGSDVRYRWPAAYSDALLYRERRQRSA
nr:hypothetical protein [Klebsiella pneumoniae subsp. pneumoniae]